MSDEILDELAGMEEQINKLTLTFIACVTDLLEAVKTNTEIVSEMAEAMAIAQSPSKEDLKKSQTLREAFDRYDFVRKLAIGKETKDGD